MHPATRANLVSLFQEMDLQTMRDRMDARMKEHMDAHMRKHVQEHMSDELREHMLADMDVAASLEWRKDMAKHEYHRDYRKKEPQLA